MADIDKSLPNVEQEIKVPSPEEVEVAKVDEDRTIVSYKEVELPNGDIEMVPVYEDDWTDDDKA